MHRTNASEIQFSFWQSRTYGLFRQRSRPGERFHPEVWGKRGWETGTPWVMDAIREDPHLPKPPRARSVTKKKTATRKARR